MVDLTAGQELAVVSSAITVGIGWDKERTAGAIGTGAPDVDLDATAVQFVGEQLFDLAFYNNLSTRDGSVVHLGRGTKAGHRLVGYDVVGSALEAAVAAGAGAAGSVAEAVAGAECVITMLPEGRHVREVYLGGGGIIEQADPDALLIDCSTIDVDSARAVNMAAMERGLQTRDAEMALARMLDDLSDS